MAPRSERPRQDLLALALGIAAFAQLGTLLRLELSGALAGYNATNLSSAMWANFVGCFVIGLFNGLKPVFDERGLAPLFSATTAGFCGALTTFSTWQGEVARWLVLWPSPSVSRAFAERNAFGRVLSAASALLTELGISCLAFQVGRGVAHLMVDPPPPPASEDAIDEEESQPLMVARGQPAPAGYGLSAPPLGHVHSAMLAVLGRRAFARWDDAVRVPARVGQGPGRSQWVFSLAFLGLLVSVTALVTALNLSLGGQLLFFVVIWAPPGALLRYLLGVWLNARPPGAGTYLANILACAVTGALMAGGAAAGCYAGSPWKQNLVKGISVGFCGSLSTTSTFVAHLHEFAFGEALIYFLISVVSAQGVLCAILGGYLGSSGASHVCA
uniref:Fluoride ion transporter CrcB n=1 Tax=Alexandrium monilatum TaxID=311494 RepID=A0A7S4UXZ4_9DINO